MNNRSLIEHFNQWPGLSAAQRRIGEAVLYEGNGEAVEVDHLMERYGFSRGEIRTAFCDPNGPLFVIEGIGRWYVTAGRLTKGSA